MFWRCRIVNRLEVYMAKIIGQVGQHPKVEDLEQCDVNGRPMFRCSHCHTFTRAKEHFAEVSVPCVFDCENCRALSGSCTRRPAVPEGGDCNTILYTCPHDGRRWWQTNAHFHLWQQVTDPAQWDILVNNGYGNPVRYVGGDFFD